MRKLIAATAILAVMLPTLTANAYRMQILTYSNLFERADIVVYDGLANPALLDHAPDAEKIFVGKKTDQHSLPQEEIVRVLIDHAQKGLCIVRLNAPRGVSTVDPRIEAIPQVIEANRVTGSESHVIRARVRSTRDLEGLLHELWEEGDSITNIVTSSPVPRRPMNLRATRAGQPAE